MTAWHTIFRATIIITGIILMAPVCPGCAEPQQKLKKKHSKPWVDRKAHGFFVFCN